MTASRISVISDTAAMQAQSRQWHREGRRIGLVPTMGFLHKGHLSLVELCRRHGDRTVVSIFVNPLQFGPNEDYQTYPRDLDRDLRLLESLDIDVVFNPAHCTFYPPGHCTFVEVEGLTPGLCGAARPGHFRGVTTVVTKLFNAVRPDVAVFGRKDYQQAAVIQRMVRDLDMGIEIVLAPTVREADGLAMSSRNTRLNPDERARAGAIFQALDTARQAVENGLTTSAQQLRRQVREHIAVALSPDIDYVEVVDPDSLEPVQTITGPVIMAVAVRLSQVRLIDNMQACPPAA